MSNKAIDITRNDIAKIADNDPRVIRALEKLFNFAAAGGVAAWDNIDFSNSNLTDIETRNHNDLQFTRLTKAVDYQMLATDDMVLVDASGGDISITLPSLSSDGVYSVKKIDSSANTVTVVLLAGLIDGEATMIIYQQYDCISSVSDGANWNIE